MALFSRSFGGLRHTDGGFAWGEVAHKRGGILAEGEGFEPSKVSLAGFQDRCTRPLCEPSTAKSTGCGERAANQLLKGPAAIAENRLAGDEGGISADQE